VYILVPTWSLSKRILHAGDSSGGKAQREQAAAHFRSTNSFWDPASFWDTIAERTVQRHTGLTAGIRHKQPLEHISDPRLECKSYHNYRKHACLIWLQSDLGVPTNDAQAFRSGYAETSVK
jgi:hypothetical protein